MPKHTFHFLNVKNGDCSIIEHGSGHVSVIDVCNARRIKQEMTLLESLEMFSRAGSGNFQQKKHPVNPIEYLKKFGIDSIFRFMLTHPDMDHMDGIKDLFEEFSPANFYDTDNNAEKEFENGSPYRKEDWDFYKNLRDTNPQTDPKRLTIFSGDDGIYRTKDWDGKRPGDAFYTLAPTPELVKEGNEAKDYNDSSYVVLYRGAAGRILISGDSHDKTWEHILEHWEDDVKDVDLLIAPHHGRKSGRSYSFLDIVNPKMTFFGNAKSEHLAYGAWNSRKLEFVTNNQANCMVVDCTGDNLTLYVTNENFAKSKNPYSFYAKQYDAWYVKEISGWDLK